jgi:AcrR family transcriptional regulator
MRAVAQAAGTTTPTVYRRFKDRRGLLRAILMKHVRRIRSHLRHQQTAQKIAESYLEFALQNPNEHRLFIEEARLLRVPTGRAEPYPIGDCRPDFALAEQALAKELGGVPEDHTHLALQMCLILDGAAMMLLNRTMPDVYEKHLKDACRSAVSAIIEQAKKPLAVA